MPQKTQKSSGLLARVAKEGRQAHAQHAADPVEYGNVQVPAGIENGVAQLAECKFGEYKEGPNKGQIYFLAAGVIKEPKVHHVNGRAQPVSGQRTQVGPEPLCDTPQSGGKRKTFADHYAWVLMEFRKLGVDTTSIDFDQIESVAQSLREQQPHFRFRTWSGSKQVIITRAGKFFVQNENGSGVAKGPYPTEEAAKAANPYVGKDPRVQHEWNGVCEYDDRDDTSNYVADDSANGVSAKPEEESGAPTDNLEFGDTQSLVEAAESGDINASQSLQDMATAAGVDPEKVRLAKSWADVVEMIEEANAGGVASDSDGASESNDQGENEIEEEPAEEEDKPWQPEKDQIFGYRPIDPKTKKPFVDVNPKTKKATPRKPVECVVVTVESKTKTVTIRDLTTKTTYKGVKWEDLEPVA